MQKCHEKGIGSLSGGADFAWVALVVVEARKCDRGDGGYGMSVVLR